MTLIPYNISVDMNGQWMYNSSVLIISFLVRSFKPAYLIFFEITNLLWSEYLVSTKKTIKLSCHIPRQNFENLLGGFHDGG